jgi:threonine/homoserine/homoserine lactone efflux protein
MTLWTAVLSFAVVAGLVTMIPGLDTALVLRATLREGRRVAFATAAGVCTGALVWGAAAAVGVSALLTASTFGYTVLRLAGATYLVVLGVRILRDALVGRVSGDRETRDDSDEPGTRRALRGWRRGLFTNLLNPKVGAFYLAMLPQFIPPHTPHLAVGVLLASVHVLEAMVWFTGLITGAQALRGFLARRGAQRAVDGVTGGVLVGFGVTLGVSAS